MNCSVQRNVSGRRYRNTVEESLLGPIDPASSGGPGHFVASGQ